LFPIAPVIPLNSSDAVPAIPDRIEPKSLDDYLEVLTRAVFQAGVTWKQIAEHWGAYRRAFHNFDCARVAAFTDADIERALMEPGILRSERKVRATVKNARMLLELNNDSRSAETSSPKESTIDSFKNYLRSFDDYSALAKDFKKRFSFMGDMNVWYFLFRVGQPVPEFETWVKTINGTHPRMREMVERS
jgi:3-methyladenine DNA glycosylase Tag